MLIDDGKLINIFDTLVRSDLEYKWEDMEYLFEARFSPLALAAYHGDNSMVKLLLDNGASIELKSTHLCECCNLLLRCAERLPDPPVFWEHSDRDADAGYLAWEQTHHDSWWTPLHYAICQGHVSTAKLLLGRGASAENIGDGGVTALHVATHCDRQRMIRYLLDNNLVDINAQSERGVTALHLAHIAGNFDLVDDYLNDHGADINLGYTDESGPWTIFAMACAEGDFKQALHYLRKGADPNFVLDREYDRYPDAWTAMRFIYGKGCPDELSKYDVRIQLEKAIMASVGKGTPSLEEAASRSTYAEDSSPLLVPFRYHLRTHRKF